MKKRMILAAALLLFTAACGTQTSAPQPADTGKTETAEPATQPAETSKPEQSVDNQRLAELLDVHQPGNALKKYSSVTISRTISSLDNTLGTGYTYVDQDRYLSETSTHEGTYVTKEEYAMGLPDEPGVSGAILIDSLETYQEWLGMAKAFTPYSILESESVSGSVEQDGYLYITTLTTDSEVKQKKYDTVIEEYGGPQYQENLDLICIYAFDSENSDLVFIDTYFADADGNKVLSIKDDYTYDKDFAPDLENSVFADWIKGNKPRKIEVTFNSGTDQAFTKEYMVPKNTVFTVFCNDNYVEQIYLDEACTQPIEKTDRVSDISVFVK